VREASRTADSGDGNDILRRDLQTLQSLLEGAEHAIISASRTPDRFNDALIVL
jgi:hypothetical protein